ncbi:hypothetical protein RYX36_034760, partial [Vicia faba]
VILTESEVLKYLQEVHLTEELYTKMGDFFDGVNLLNILMVSEFEEPLALARDSSLRVGLFDSAKTSKGSHMKNL